MLTALLLALTCPAPQEPGPVESWEPRPAVVVRNPDGQPRTELLRVSVPWPRGALRELRAARIGDDVAPAVTLMRWSDGSVRVAQVHPSVTLSPGETLLRVEPAADRAAGAASFARTPAFRVELVDPFGRTFAARLGVEDWQPVPELTSPRVRVRRQRQSLERRDDGGVPTALLGVRAFLVELAAVGGSPARAELTLALHDDPAAGEPVFGPVRFTSLALTCDDAAVRLLPRERDALGLRPPEPDPAGAGFRQVLLGPSHALYLGDRSAKTFRFDIAVVGPPDGVDPGDAATRQAALRAAVERPLLALPELDWVRSTGAFGAHGGPAPWTVDEPDSGALIAACVRATPLATGPFGDFGDPRDAAAQGTPRNGPCALHNLLRWRSADLWSLAEAATLQHTLRPTPAEPPRLPAELAAYRQGLSPRALREPHGFTSLDYEHFSVDLLFDWYWLSGDPSARDEIRRMTSALPGLLAALPFETSRGEGRCLKAAVLGAIACGDETLLAPVADRFAARIVPRLGVLRGEGWALAQPPDVRALGADVAFEAPWQMAALAEGVHALWRERGDDSLRELVVRIGVAIATAGFEDGVGPKSFFAVRDPSRFARPIGHRPTEGTAWFSITTLALAGALATSTTDRSAVDRAADFLVRSNLETAPAAVRGNVWFQVFLDRNPALR
ncbi:MAG: hypothetical protein IPM29_30280 [Planctomycetes bacterium]|nr:hypothetical protein [Planctomycetota bacterium]